MTIKIETPPNTMPRIDVLYAVLSVDANGEGVVAAPIAPGYLSVPLIAADEVRLRQIIPIAQMMATKTGMKMRVVKFETRIELREIMP